MLPLIWWDDSQVNFPFRSFGLPAYVDFRLIGGNRYESLPTIGSVLGASLIGIDKSSQDNNDYVTMLRQFFNKANGTNLILNRLDQRTGGSFWYEVWPAVAYSMVVDLYPAKEEMQEPMKTTAEVWIGAINKLSEGRDYPDFNFTAFDFKNYKGYYNNVRRETEAAAGLAWLQYMSWVKFKEDKFLKSAKMCMVYLENLPAKDGPYYEILMPYGAYLAIRMNAELGTNYDEMKMLNWCFDGDNTDRDGWGVIHERWEEYDVHGLVGQRKWEQYAFAMNTFSQVAALAPIVKYNPAYSHSIGKWILNAANASRLFYADEHPKNRQTSAVWQGDPEHVICYEGVRKKIDNVNGFGPLIGILAEKGPYAVGDQVKNMSAMTDICLYGSAWVGMLASIVDTTNVKGILRLNCNATDFFSQKDYPVYLYFNPYFETKEVVLEGIDGQVNIFDLVSKQYVGKSVSGKPVISIKGNTAMTMVYIPAGAKITIKKNQLWANNQIIDFKYK